MSRALQQRAVAFLARPVPRGVSYAPGSIAERILAAYAGEGRLAADAELVELLELCLAETAAAIDSHRGEAAAYFRESATIQRGILRELRTGGRAGSS
jgi:hypothetical protein